MRSLILSLSISPYNKLDLKQTVARLSLNKLLLEFQGLGSFYKPFGC